MEMRKPMILLVLITSISTASIAQTWQETWTNMSKEEKMMKMNAFRADNQKFLKDSLGMTGTQLKSIDSVNSIYLKGLNQIEKSSDTDDQKLAKAREITKTRGTDLDNIMGEEKHGKFSQYLYGKLKDTER
jgi:hypothetical protein